MTETKGKVQPKTPPAKPFVAPPTYVGMPCYWRHGLADPATVPEGGEISAFVTEVCGNGRVRLAVLNVDNSTFTVHDDPVPHFSDPAARRITESDPDAGTWYENQNVLTIKEISAVRELLASFAAKPAAG
jgi:hypothetical protein